MVVILIITYFDALIILYLASGHPFRLAPLPFWHNSFILWLPSYLSNTIRCSRIILYFSHSRPIISHFPRSFGSFQKWVIFINQDLCLQCPLGDRTRKYFVYMCLYVYTTHSHPTYIHIYFSMCVCVWWIHINISNSNPTS